jgi:exopolysaccharide biosynthesis WecB/TagA/CpsF family protein
MNAIVDCASAEIPAIVTHLPVHSLVTFSANDRLRSIINEFDLVAPDGQPVRWALNVLCTENLPNRVYGPELMLRLCRRAAREKVGIYLYGSSTDVVERLYTALCNELPSLQVVGYESPPYRALTADEDAAMVKRINESGARILFVGLGCPKQDLFAYDHRHSLKAVQVCVGAAFDFLSGNKTMAPKWMQERGLEWAFRLWQEPRRLWRRYVWTNSVFICKVAIRVLGFKAPEEST